MLGSNRIEGGRAYEAVESVIQRRQTWKVLGDVESPVEYSEARLKQCDSIVRAAIGTAGWAPFHYDRGVNDLAEPWRVDWLQNNVCRSVSKSFLTWFDDVKPSNKLPAMLAGCGSLILVSWLPQFCSQMGDEKQVDEKQKRVDEEHLAASSAYIQNLLLLLTAANLGTYWSSGGQFRSPEMFERLGITHQGKLLGAIFVDYSEILENGQEDGLERLAGKHRNRRCTELGWMAEISQV